MGCGGSRETRDHLGFGCCGSVVSCSRVALYFTDRSFVRSCIY